LSVFFCDRMRSENIKTTVRPLRTFAWFERKTTYLLGKCEQIVK
jgi:hypothetical protein